MIAGIRFRPYGQIYYFSTDLDIPLQTAVVTETDQGFGLGKVCGLYEILPKDAPEGPLAPVVRIATDEDIKKHEENIFLAKEASAFCRASIQTRKLDMKLVDVEIYMDRSKFIFYFTAPARIDFRELVKDLVREYRSRIELRQIGVRHETQMVGAVGNCGMVCCCRRYLRKFAPVTIRMAKEQNLFLNPAKISGICGRLLCCLSYEQENYDIFHRLCPKLGKRYQTIKGSMKVLRANMFNNSVFVLNEHNEEIELSLDAWAELEPHRPEQKHVAPSKVGKAPSKDYELMVVSVGPEAMDNFADVDAVFDARVAADAQEQQNSGGVFGLVPQQQKVSPSTSEQSASSTGIITAKKASSNNIVETSHTTAVNTTGKARGKKRKRPRYDAD